MLDLATDHPFGLAPFPLGVAFPYAQDRDQASFLGGTGPQVDLLVSFAVVLARFAMADDRVGDAVLLEHGCRDHAGIGTGLVPMDVLAADLDATAG